MKNPEPAAGALAAVFPWMQPEKTLLTQEEILAYYEEYDRG